ncbi:hypothetical protein GGER_51270 [Serratia rubidaea]
MQWFFLLPEFVLQAAALLLLLFNRFFFLGDALLDVFKLAFVVVGGMAG